jgi:transcriptional regulator with XRE-family HTH domain
MTMDLDWRKVGEVIADLRAKRKLARPDVARRVGVTSNYLGMVERGQRTLSFTTLAKLAEVFEVPEAFITCLGTRLPKVGDPRHPFAKVLKATQEAMLAAIDDDEAAKARRR